MILYADTSWLAKLYLIEIGSTDVRRAVRTAEQVVTSRITYAEIRVALARARRNGRIDDSVFHATRSEFDRGWRSMLVLEVTDETTREAGDLGDRYPIRGFDAIHLASAAALRNEAKSELAFMTSDQRLRESAMAEGFSV